jgi:pyruvate dehydrogenase E2 component (dihydrolipoyllysine-residue acetyltransferase)
MIAITMPQLSHYMTDGKVVHWYKKEGDHVEEGEPLLEIETIKAMTELCVPNAGTIVRILVQEGETVECETLLAEIEV